MCHSYSLPSPPAGLRQWRRAERRGLGFGERGAQEVSIESNYFISFSTSSKNFSALPSRKSLELEIK
jgi:hypothetical protein